MRTRIKICGLTCIEDAICAAQMGADALGFIFVKESPRYITPKRVAGITKLLPPFVFRIGVFKDHDPEWIRKVFSMCKLHAVQLHGSEPPDYCLNLGVEFIKAFRIRDKDSLRQIPLYYKNENETTKNRPFLLDTFMSEKVGGTGRTFNWELAVDASKYGPVILSGGLNPENVSKAICMVKPFAVDTSSGIEIRPGKKDIIKMKAFIDNVIKINPIAFNE